MVTEVEGYQVKFDPGGTGIVATNVEEAVKELDGRTITFKKYRYDVVASEQAFDLDAAENVQGVFIEGLEQCDEWSLLGLTVTVEEETFPGAVVTINTVVQS